MPEPANPADQKSDSTMLSGVVRTGDSTALCEHTPANRDAFVRWYSDPDIALLLRHDLEPLNTRQAVAYFSGIILPLSQHGHAWAIHARDSGRLIGTAAITDINTHEQSCLFRIVIGEKDAWGCGFGTDASRLVAQHVFDSLPITRIRLEVFEHNPRAFRAYQRVGYRQYDRYQERVRGKDVTLDILAMELTPAMLASNLPSAVDTDNTTSAPKQG